MTGLQIFAILQLLLAFNVSTSTVATVQAILETPNATTTVVAPILITPVQNTPTPVFQFNGTIQPMPEVPAPVDKSEIVVEVSRVKESSESTPFGYYFLKVSVLNSEGITTPIKESENPRQNISMEVGGVIESRFIDTQTHRESKVWFHTFGFEPGSVGVHSITFTSGNLTKTITVEVK